MNWASIGIIVSLLLLTACIPKQAHEQINHTDITFKPVSNLTLIAINGEKTIGNITLEKGHCYNVTSNNIIREYTCEIK